MHELALFAGAGGGLLATKWLLGWRSVCYVENEPYCIEILKARIRDGLLDDAPIWDDARTFDGQPWRGCVDIVTAGFPCQPFSVAGKRAGSSDERNLWPSTIRIIREVGPRFCLLENVPGLLADEYFGTILGELSESGYDARWNVISAAEVGAPHKRDRVWIRAEQRGPLPHTCGGRRSSKQLQAGRNVAGLCGENVADAERNGLEGAEPTAGEKTEVRRRSAECGAEVVNADTVRLEKREKARADNPIIEGPGWWSVEPDVGRVADELADRLD